MAIPSELRDFEFSEKLDFFALLVDARSGISPQMIEVWQHYQDRQFPRVLLVQGIEFSESDFDDIVLIGNRVLEQFATPYLVLHDEIGEPTGLISLEDNIVHDYSGSTVTNYPAEKEMIELIKDFQDEYTQLYKELGTEGFFQGIFAIALPIGSSKRFGTPELNRIIESLTKH
ncbi:MAG: hypothetical protein ACO3HP_01350 [Candidatus Nanopelagicaceae bacterium]